MWVPPHTKRGRHNSPTLGILGHPVILQPDINSAYPMQNTAEYTCAYCGEPNVTFVDISAGAQQSYVEDCQVCCQPNVLFLAIDEQTLDIEINSEPEN